MSSTFFILVKLFNTAVFLSDRNAKCTIKPAVLRILPTTADPAGQGKKNGAETAP